MANALNKTLTTAMMSGVMVFALAAPSWAKIDYTTKNGGAAVASVDVPNPAATAAYLQSFIQAQSMNQMLQGNMNNMLATTMTQQLMSGQFNPGQMLQAVAGQLIQQQIGKFMEQAGLSNFGGLAQGLGGGLMGNTGGLGGLGGLGGMSGIGGIGGLGGLGGTSLGGLGNFGGLAGGLGGASGGLDGLFGSIAGSVVNQVVAGGIQTVVDKITDKITNSDSSGSGDSGSSYNSAYDPVDTSNNFGGATIVLSKDAAVDTSSDNYNAGLNAALTGQSKSTTYYIATGTDQGVYDSNYLAGYTAGLPYYNTASN